MPYLFDDVFQQYPASTAPFLHAQYDDWAQSQPLKGLRILHHVPVVNNTLLKIACLVAAGAEVTASNPDFLIPCPQAVAALKKENIPFASDLSKLNRKNYDVYLDCGATLYQTLGAPRIGCVELTGTGDTIYRTLALPCPVISVDKTLTKQLETVFGGAISGVQAIKKLTSNDNLPTAWLIIGFGKIGRGFAYVCQQNNWEVSITDTNADARLQAEKLNLTSVDGNDNNAMRAAIQHADIIITATGGYDVLRDYPIALFENKLLGNMGVLDEFGPRFDASQILFEKRPINFALSDPTPIEFIDPEMFAHNQVTVDLLSGKLTPSVHNMKRQDDEQIINRWCQHHGRTRADIDKWFLKFV